MVQWNSSHPEDEATPIMHPVRMELAPHARLGRRMAASTAIFTLLVFHVSMVTIGALNYDADCATHLWLYLVIYGGVGLLFVYLLFREWLYYARLSSLPSLFNLILLIIFYALLSTAGGFLAYYTITTRDTCMTTAPLLYRWCEAAVLFFAILTGLFLVIPLVRGLARIFCAPCALCLISCVETVGVDVEVGDSGVAAMGEQFAGEGGGAGAGAGAGAGVGGGRSGMGSASGKEQANAAAAAATVVLLGPCMICLMPCYYICARPLIKCFSAVCSPIGICFTRLLEACGLVNLEDGTLSITNPLSGTSLPGVARGCAQVALAPGCIVPGRSLVALFVNTAALLWFFLYLAFILYDSWEVVCSRYDPGVSFNSAPLTWLLNGAPSPIHWLMLFFAVGGIVIVVLSFFHDMFSGPKPPPRSYYEASLWRGRRQVRVLSWVALLATFLGWGILLSYYTFTDDGCAAQGGDRPLQSLYNVAYLLVLLLCVIFGLIAVLGCCVVLDCFVSGRVRFVMLLSTPEQPLPPPPEQFATGGTRDGDERLVPGVPPRDATSKQYGTAGGAMLIGAVEESRSRLCTANDVPTADWSSPGAKLPKPR